MALFLPELRRRTKIPLMPIAGASLAVLLVGTLGLVGQPQFARRLPPGQQVGEALTQRVNLWRAGVAMANDRPLIGQGPDTFDDRFPRFQGAELAKLGRQRYSGAHNLFVSQLAATGYPGLVLLVAVLVFAAMRAVGAWRRLREVESSGQRGQESRARDVRLALVAVVAGLAAYVVQGCFALSQIGLNFLLWALLGLLCSISLGVGVPSTLRPRAIVTRPPGTTMLSAEADLSDRTRRPGGRRTSRGTDLAPGVITVLACIALMVAVSAASRPLRADHNAWAVKADQVSRRSAPDQAPQASRQGARMAKAISLNPWEPSYLTTYADAFVNGASSLPAGSPSQTAALRMARRNYERAIELSPHNPYFLERYADILLKLHEVDPTADEARAEAIQALQRAVRADPYSTRLRERLRVTRTS